MRRRLVIPAMVIALSLACEQDRLPTAPREVKPLSAISDASQGGDPHFSFLRPLVRRPLRPAGEFEPRFLPHLAVEVCERTAAGCGPLAARFTSAGRGAERLRVVGPGGDASHADDDDGDIDEADDDEEDRRTARYAVSWRTRRANLNPAKTYRIRVLVRDVELGFADVRVVRSGRELRNVNTGEYVPLRNGQTLRIAFRIEKGVRGAAAVGAEGGEVTSSDGAVTLAIPPGAVAQDVVISASPAAGPGALVPAGLQGVRAVGSAWSLEPHDVRFTQPVTVSLDYAPALAGVGSAGRLGVVHWDPQAAFVEAVSAFDDGAAKRLVFELDDLSNVSLVETPEANGYSLYETRWAIPTLRASPSAEFDDWQAAGAAIAFDQSGTAGAPHIEVRLVTSDGINVPASCPAGYHPLWHQTALTCLPSLTRELGDADRVIIYLITLGFTNPATVPNATTLRHQIGHALGIGHPWRLPGPPAAALTGPDPFPVMSDLSFTNCPETGCIPFPIGQAPPLPQFSRTGLHAQDVAAVRAKYPRPLGPHFAVDRLEVVGNIAGGFVDDFADGSLTTPPTSGIRCRQPAAEEGGYLRLPLPSTFCVLGEPVPAMRIRDGHGDATITAAFRPDVPPPHGAYRLQVFTWGPANRNESASIELQYAGGTRIFTSVIPVSGNPPVTGDPVGGVPVYVDLSSVSTLLLRLVVNDATNLVSASFSLDGGQVFTPVALPTEGRLFVGASEAVVALSSVAPEHNQSPVASIELPVDRTGYPQGAAISFRGSASDPEDGTVPPGSLVWASDRDGQLGAGASLARTDLSLGTHHITLRATDSQGGVTTASVNIIVAPASTAFDRAVDRFEVVGNIPGGFADDFDDGSLGAPPTSELRCIQPSSESGGFLRLSSLDGANTFTPGVLVDHCLLGQEGAPTRLRKGRGNAVATAVFRADALPLGHGYGLLMSTFRGNGAVGISVSGQDRGLVVGAGGPSELIDLRGVDRIYLRLELDDVTDGGGLVTPSFSIDGGQTFTPVPTPPGARVYVGSDEVVVSVNAHAVFSAGPNAAPSASIASPPDQMGFPQGAPIAFHGSGVDPEDGTLSDAALVWMSNRDGQIGTGASFTSSALSLGAHLITLTATDSRGSTSSATRQLTVVPASAGFDFAVDWLRISGNVEGGVDGRFVDEFDDGSLTTPPTSNFTCFQPTSESGDFLRLSSTDGSQFTAFNQLVDRCELLGATARLQDGRGDAAIDAAFRADAPSALQNYRLRLLTRGSGPEESVSLVVGPTGVIAEVRKDGAVRQGTAVTVNLTAVARLILRLELNDATNRVTASFSIDGGTTFVPVPLPVEGSLFTNASEAVVSFIAAVSVIANRAPTYGRPRAAGRPSSIYGARHTGATEAPSLPTVARILASSASAAM